MCNNENISFATLCTQSATRIYGKVELNNGLPYDNFGCVNWDKVNNQTTTARAYEVDRYRYSPDYYNI